MSAGFRYSISDPDDRVLGRVLAARAAANGDRTFLVYKGIRSVSYAELDDRASRAAMGFHRLGIGRGDRVAVMASNRPEYLFIMFGLARLGAVLVTINIHHKGSVLGHVLSNSGAKAVVVEPDLTERVAEVAGQLGARLIVLDRTDVFDQRPLDFAVDVRHDDLQQILYTSGTTGPSKGVMITHNQAFAFADYVMQAMAMTRDDVYYTCLPLFHINAQLTTLGALLNDASAVLYDRFSASTFWKEVRDSGATAFSLFGAMAYILHKQEPSPLDRTSRVRVCWAFPAPYDILEEFERRFGLRVLTAYASTEANFVAITDIDTPLRPNAAGLVHPRFEVALVDERDRPVPTGATGEIVTRPRDPYTMMLGYHGMPEATAAAFRNLWYHTGDAGRFDEDGYLYFIDRIKDVIRRRGENISSYEVEEVVNGHPGVLECAAVAQKSELSEDEIKIVIVPRPGATIDPAELVAWCDARMAYFMVPRFVEFVDELPKTPNGKVEKHRLRERPLASLWDRQRP